MEILWEIVGNSNLAHNGRIKWCPLAKIRLLHLPLELHLPNSNLPWDLLPLTTWHMVFHWDLLPTFYIMEPWALILYHCLLTIVLTEALMSCTLSEISIKTLGFHSWGVPPFGVWWIVDHWYNSFYSCFDLICFHMLLSIC